MIERIKMVIIDIIYIYILILPFCLASGLAVEIQLTRKRTTRRQVAGIVQEGEYSLGGAQKIAERSYLASVIIGLSVEKL